MNALWERSDFRRLTGKAWRPGGLELTRRALDWCVAHKLLRPGALAIDMGCGAGGTLDLLLQTGLRAVGIDKAVGLEGNAVPEFSAAVRLRADVTSPPLAIGVAELILFECVLSLLPDPLAALRPACRTLTGRGLCIIGDITRREGVPAAKMSPTSCFSGARSPGEWRALFHAAGLRILLEEDHSRALTELAARLLWYGEAMPEAFFSQAQGVPGSDRCCHTRGYGLWIACKVSNHNGIFDERLDVGFASLGSPGLLLQPVAPSSYATDHKPRQP